MIRQHMRFLGYIMFVLLNCSLPFFCAYGGVMQMSGDDIRNSAGEQCLSYSQVDGFQYSNVSIPLNNNQWTRAINVEEGKTVKFEWSTIGLESKPRKYLVLVRLDPRFDRPVIYIQKYNYNTQLYDSDFHTFLGGKLEQYNHSFDLEFSNRITDFDSYVTFSNRSKIPVSRDDIVNINLITAEKFFGSNTGFNNGEMHSNSQYLANMYTDIGDWSDNKILYASAEKLCEFLSNVENFTSLCIEDQFSGESILPLPQNDYSLWLGSVYNMPLLDHAGNIPECELSYSDSFKWGELCQSSQGAGLEIRIGGRVIKDVSQQMMPLSQSASPNVYYSTNYNGFLDFTLPFAMVQLAGDNSNLYIKDLAQSILQGSYTEFQEFLVSEGQNGRPLSFRNIAIGRAFFEVVIGRGTTLLSDAQNSDIALEYLFNDGTTPSPNETGISASGTVSTNSPIQGVMWVRASSRSDEVSGKVMVNTASYNGNGLVADGLYYKVLDPLIEKFNRVTKMMFISLTHDTRLQIIARTSLTLYIVIYALFFLAGAVEISISDLVARIVKIAIIVAMFQPRSWEYFHENVFVMFMEGAAELASRINGSTSSITNPFGFIDPLIDRFTDPQLWALMGSQLLVFKDGLCFATILVVISIIIYFLGVLEVVVAYLMAMVGLAVMISLAPIFIIFMLFSATRGIFDNWMSLAFNYLIQPSVLLAFFLLVDGIMSAQLTHVVVDACLGHEPVKLYLDLRHMGLDTSFDITLPFFDLIPRYIPQLQEVENMSSIQGVMEAASGGKNAVSIMLASLLMLAYGMVSLNLLGFVNTVNAQLTSAPAGLNTAPTASITGDVAGITGSIAGVGGAAAAVVGGGALALGAGTVTFAAKTAARGAVAVGAGATVAAGGGVMRLAARTPMLWGGGVSSGLDYHGKQVMSSSVGLSKYVLSGTGKTALRNMKKVSKVTLKAAGKSLGFSARMFSKSELAMKTIQHTAPVVSTAFKGVKNYTKQHGALNIVKTLVKSPLIEPYMLGKTVLMAPKSIAKSLYATGNTVYLLGKKVSEKDFIKNKVLSIQQDAQKMVDGTTSGVGSVKQGLLVATKDFIQGIKQSPAQLKAGIGSARDRIQSRISAMDDSIRNQFDNLDKEFADKTSSTRTIIKRTDLPQTRYQAKETINLNVPSSRPVSNDSRFDKIAGAVFDHSNYQKS